MLKTNRSIRYFPGREYQKEKSGNIDKIIADIVVAQKLMMKFRQGTTS